MIKSLYIHIPFCRKRCLYCDFYSQTNLKLKNAYLQALAKEAESYRNFPVRLNTIYIGGWTPSLLTGKEFRFLFKLIFKLFKMGESPEITVEINPDSAPYLLKTLKNLGVNRISIGFQFLSRRLLKKSGRLHTGAKAVKSFNLARKSGFKNINVDILYGFPTQTIAVLDETLNKIISLNPEHISAYLYTPPKRKSTLFRKETLSDEKIFDMYRLLCRNLAKAKFKHYEISNFARKNFLSEHNLNYWNGHDFIGLGAGATSTIKNLRLKNKRIPLYIRNPLEKEKEELTKQEKEFEKKFLALRSRTGIPYRKKHDKFIKKGWLEKSRGKIKFTQNGWFVSNSVIAEII